MSMNRSILLSSNVDLVPRRTAHNSCMNGSSCSVKAMKPSSFFASARVCLPVVLLSFMGGSIPYSVNNSPNFLLLAKTCRTSSGAVTPRRSINEESNSCFSSRNSSSLSISMELSTSNTGCVNIRSVISISLISFNGNSLERI